MLVIAVLFVLSVTFALAVRADTEGCRPQGESELHCLYRLNASAFYAKLDTDLRRITDVRKQHLRLAAEVVKNNRTERIPEVLELIVRAKEIDGPYEYFGDLMRDPRGSGLKAWRAAADMHLWNNQAIAKMMTLTGKMYFALGDAHRAIEMLRKVVISFPGTGYISEVREAQFVLEDIKNSSGGGILKGYNKYFFYN
jgi:hypothetical protein